MQVWPLSYIESVLEKRNYCNLQREVILVSDVQLNLTEFSGFESRQKHEIDNGSAFVESSYFVLTVQR